MSSCFAPGGGWLFRRDCLDRLLPLPANQLRQGADTYMTRGVALFGPVAASTGTGAAYRSHGSNDSNSGVLDLAGIRRALERQVRCGRLLDELALAREKPPLMDPLDAPDSLFLAQRLTSLRLDAGRHPFPADSSLTLARRGVDAAFGREDVPVAVRVAQACWFLVMPVLPRSLAARAARSLLQPTSQSKGVSNFVRALTRGISGAGGRRPRRDGPPDPAGPRAQTPR